MQALGAARASLQSAVAARERTEERGRDGALVEAHDLEPPAEKVLPMLADLRTELSTLGFRAVMLSGSGTTIFCVGTPRGDVVDTWQDAIRAKFDVEVYEEMFCRRLPDERLWYAEQPEGAKLVDLDADGATMRGYQYKLMKRVGRKQLPSLAALDRVVAVLNVRASHWTTALCDLRNRRFEYHDSMAAAIPGRAARADDGDDDGLWRNDTERDAFFGARVGRARAAEQ